MSQELIQAVMVLTKQKGFAPEVIFESLEAALLQAYRKEPTSNPDAYVVIDRETGVYKVMAKNKLWKLLNYLKQKSACWTLAKR